MTELEFQIVDWLGGTSALDDATFAAFQILHRGVALTEVHDTLARTTRPTIRVAAFHVAEWLVCNYWRLAFEPRSMSSPTPSYARAHSMASIGGGYAWPDLEFSGDGESVVISMRDESQADVAAIRYLRRYRVELPRAELEAAIDRFVARVVERVSAVFPNEHRLSELWAELQEERNDPDLAQWCRLEARAGFDPGESTEPWRESVEWLRTEAGNFATEDMIGVAGVDALVASIEAMKKSTTRAQLPILARVGDAGTGAPWERGTRLAQVARETLGLASGPMTNKRLGDAVGIDVPFTPTASKRPAVEGARRTGESTYANLLFGPTRPSSQRFYLARLLGMAILGEDRVLPITRAPTAVQKVNRAFAQELLLPWSELNDWTDEHGLSEESIATIAERYEVSELLVASTLVNRGKLPRNRLEAFGDV